MALSAPLLSYKYYIFFSIILSTIIIIIYQSTGRWVKVVINGVERLILTTAGGIVVNDSLGRPIPLPDLGRGNNNTPTNNTPTNNTPTNNTPTNNTPTNNTPTNNAPTNNTPTNNTPTNNAPTNSTPTNNAPTNKYVSPGRYKAKIKIYYNEKILLRVKNNTHSFIIPFILNKLDITLPEGSEKLTQYSFGVFILSLIAFMSFINVIGYFFTLYLVHRYDIVTKFPKLKKIKNYFEKSSLFLIIIECLFCVVCLLILMVTSFFYLKSIIIN